VLHRSANIAQIDRRERSVASFGRDSFSVLYRGMHPACVRYAASRSSIKEMDCGSLDGALWRRVGSASQRTGASSLW
jgi:hypothetical protein